MKAGHLSQAACTIKEPIELDAPILARPKLRSHKLSLQGFSMSTRDQDQANKCHRGREYLVYLMHVQTCLRCWYPAVAVAMVDMRHVACSWIARVLKTALETSGSESLKVANTRSSQKQPPRKEQVANLLTPSDDCPEPPVIALCHGLARLDLS